MQLINNDCLKVMLLMANDSVDLVVTSPPYYNAREYSKWKCYTDYILDMEKIFSQAVKVLKN